MKFKSNSNSNLPLTQIATVVIFLIGAASANAQDDQSSTLLPQVTISAGRGSDVEKMNLSTTVLTREQIVNSPAITVDQVLNAIPGVNISQSEGSMHPTGQGVALNIRGMGATTSIATLVMVDGVPVNDPIFKVVDWTQIPKDSIERIEVIKGGGASVLWGNMAMAGVINIITRAPIIDKTSYNVGVGSYGTQQASMNRGFQLSQGLSMGISYDGQHSSGYNWNPPGTAYGTPTSTLGENLKTSFYFKPDGVSNYALDVLIHQNTLENQQYAQQNVTMDTYRINFRGTKKISADSSLNVAAWIGDGHDNFQNMSPSLVKLQEQLKYSTSGGSIDYRGQFGDIQDFKFGADYRQISMDNNSQMFSPASSYPGLYTSTGNHQFFGLFAQGTYRSKNLPAEVTVGLREDYWNATNQYSTSTASGYPQNGNLPSTDVSQFDPSITGRYFVTDALSFRAAAYRSIAAPGMNQMYRTFASSRQWEANPNLVPMNNLGKEVGIDYETSLSKTGLTYFENNLSNYISNVNVSSTLAQYQNVGSASFSGYELEHKQTITSNTSITFGAVKTDAHTTNSTVITNNVQLGQVPPWALFASMDHKFSENLITNVRVKDIPKYCDTTTSTCATPDGGATLIDIGATYKLDKASQIYGSIQNLTNKSYIDNQSSGTVLAPPRTAFVGYRGSF